MEEEEEEEERSIEIRRDENEWNSESEKRI